MNRLAYYNDQQKKQVVRAFFPLVSTGKEKDAETGYGYFGARYMDHELMTMWLSVDPMSDKYPSISPYAYCAWNPLKLIDPDGREIDDYFTKDGKYLGSDNAQSNYVRIIDENIWNTLSKDENGNIDHDIGGILSYSFSEASRHGMSNIGQLSVYQHYNITGCKIEASPDEDVETLNAGMTLKTKKTTNDMVIISHLYINLKANASPDSYGESLCDNADEITSCFVHERNHIRRAIKMGFSQWYKMNSTSAGKRDIEKSAIQSQRMHSSWQGCREHFKKKVEDYENTFN